MPGYWGGDIPWVTPKDLSSLRGRYVTGGERAITADGLANSAARVIPAGSVLLSSRAPIGLVGIAAVPLSTNQGCRSFVPGPLVDPEYAYYRFLTMSEDFIARASGSTFMEISGSALADVPFYFPPLREQKAIAEVLGALDDKIAANTALAATAEQVLRAEIDAVWFRSDDRNSTLSDFVELNPKVTMPRTDAALYVDMKRLPESGWSIDGLDYREPKGGARFENGDTLLARITPCLENRKTGFVDHLPEGRAAVGSTEFIVLRARSGVAPPISFLLATAPRFRDHAIQHMIGTSGRQRVAASDLASFELPNPDPDWLADFGSRAVAVFDLVASQAAESRTLAAMRDALLPQLMSGKLRVRDAEDLIVQAGV